MYQLAVTVGFLGAYLVNYQLLAWAESGTQLSVDWLNKIFITEVWRGMLGMETLPAILFFIIIFFIPESPRWLIVRGKELKAVNILEKIYNSITEAKSQLNETKSVLTSETKSEWSLLMKPGIFKAVIIGVCIAILGQFMGVNAVLYYGPSIFENEQEEAGYSQGISEEEVQADENQRNNHSRNSVINKFLAAYHNTAMQTVNFHFTKFW